MAGWPTRNGQLSRKSTPDRDKRRTYQTYAPEHRAALATISGLEGDDDKTTHFLLSGRYVDVITRRRGEWRFQKRRAVYDSGVLFEGEVTDPGPAFLTGARDASDPIYAALSDQTSGLPDRA